jgi:hypothetical protein
MSFSLRLSYREQFSSASDRRLLKELEHACRVISGDDQAGQA